MAQFNNTNNNRNNTYDSTFYCTITHQIMTDPVIDGEGNTYERDAIMQWLQTHNQSPITRNPLNSTDLRPNRSLKNLIETTLANSSSLTSTHIVNVTHEQQAIVVQPLSIQNKVKLISENNVHKTYRLLTSIKSPELQTRIPTDIVVVIDVSGSMDSEATSGTNGSERSGLTLLDITKHALKTIINTLDEHDRLAIVSFATNAKVVCNLTHMNSTGKAIATSLVEQMKTEGTTNLWDGVVKGMDILKNRQLTDSSIVNNSSVLVLTDGQPSEIPPRGHIAMLKRYRDLNGGNLPGSINTFGFGYNLDSKLLQEFALEGNGMYCFIPDCSFVGTAFVNAMANIIVTTAIKSVLSIESDENIHIIRDDENNESGHSVNTWGHSVSIGSIQSGQTIDVIKTIEVPINFDITNIKVNLRYYACGTTFNDASVSIDHDIIEDTIDDDEIEYHHIRTGTVNAINQVMDIMRRGETHPKLIEAQQVIENFIANIKDSLVITDSDSSLFKQYSMKVLEDLEGQITQALSRLEWYTKWGKHYLPSLARAHDLQQCNNFKDPGIQHLGGELFKEIRDKADDMYCDMPAPIPSRRITQPSTQSSYQTGGNIQRPVVNTAPVSMRAMSYNTGCIHGDCIVKMVDKNNKQISDLVKGDVLEDGSIIKCILRTTCSQKESQLVHFSGGLILTPYHPILYNNTWRFPINVGVLENTICDAVYSFLVCKPDGSYANSITVNGIKCITLAHGIIDNNIARHDFFGSENIVTDLKCFSSWDLGLVEVTEECFRRDPSTNLINSIVDLK